jgi:hypothetical protein
MCFFVSVVCLLFVIAVWESIRDKKWLHTISMRKTRCRYTCRKHEIVGRRELSEMNLSEKETFKLENDVAMVMFQQNI